MVALKYVPADPFSSEQTRAATLPNIAVSGQDRSPMSCAGRYPLRGCMGATGVVSVL